MQRQEGYACVTVVVPLGDLSSGRLRALALLSRSFSDGTVRATIGQNVLLRWVPTEHVATLHRLLEVIGLAEPDPESIADVASCPGAESCKLAVTQSRGLAELVGAHFRASRSWVDRAPGLTIRVSGCPNGCGLHHVASVGFQGGLRKIEGRAAPYYNVFVGGGDLGASQARFGRMLAKVPARRAPDVIERLVRLYEAHRTEGESITGYLGRVSAADVTTALADLEGELGAEDFVDLGETASFRPDATEGECAA
jgi:sulfite reductase beta subunit-like hemoprotein